jgi:DNA-binding LacI/PurR family transcriptional regulator
MSESRRVTLSEVAALAGTSVPTASKVMRGRTDVSTGMRRRVLDAAHQLGYAGADHRLARATPLPPLVDLVVSNLEGTWANGVLAGVEDAATAAGSDVVITVARPGRDWVARLLRRPSEGAVIMLVDPAPAELSALRRAGIPLVLIDPMSPPPPDVPRVGVTNWEGGRTAAEHLAALGHERFGIIGGSRNHLYSKARIDGFRSEVPGASTRIGFGDWHREPAHKAALAILEGPARPTAIFACSDVMALGAYDAAADLGLRIPGDLSVVGFDDVPEAVWASPPLTTVRQPITEMGAAAMRLLLAESSNRGQRSGIPRFELATSLVVRESTTRA